MKTPGDRYRDLQKAEAARKALHKHNLWLNRHPDHPEAIARAEAKLAARVAKAEKAEAKQAKKIARVAKPTFSKDVVLRNFELDPNGLGGLRPKPGARIEPTRALRHAFAGPNWKCYAEGMSTSAKRVLSILLKEQNK